MKYGCGAGLCNRLRTALSYLEYAKSIGQELEFIWPVNDACPDKFDNHFEPIDGLTVTYEWKDVKWGVFPHGDFKPNFKLLKPKYETRQLGCEYNAIHIRSSEHWVENREHPSKFIEFANKYQTPIFLDTGGLPVAYDNKPIWLATDIRKTQLKFYDLDWVRFYQDIDSCDKINGPHRHTDLKHSVIDLFMCVGADEFMGTEFSSFSETINALREKPGVLVNG